MTETFDRICFFEDWYFRSVTSAAGESRIGGLDDWDGASVAPRVKGRVFRTKDGVRLAGFHIAASRAAKGFVLVAHGNAMLAEHILPTFVDLNSPDFDIVLYDDRGYGASEGTTRFLAMFADARHIFEAMRAEVGGHGFGYGLSQGGIVLSNALLSGVAGIDGVVIDGSPGDLPWYLCSSGFDPATRVTEATLAGEAVMILSGGRDQVISRDWMRPLIEAGRARGAELVLKDDYPHPFQEPAAAMLMERLGLIWSFFLRRAAANLR